jgi:hypothetical protein
MGTEPATGACCGKQSLCLYFQAVGCHNPSDCFLINPNKPQNPRQKSWELLSIDAKKFHSFCCKRACRANRACQPGGRNRGDGGCGCLWLVQPWPPHPPQEASFLPRKSIPAKIIFQQIDKTIHIGVVSVQPAFYPSAGRATEGTGNRGDGGCG